MGTIALNSQITVDESSSLQNQIATSVAGDANDNDISVGDINNNSLDSGLPYPFESRLFTLMGTVSAASMQVALSGYDSTYTNGQDLITISGINYTDLAFTDSAGAPLDGDWSGLYTVDGTQIFLYTDSTNNNIVIGRKGTAGGVPNAQDDAPDTSGAIVFAAYLDPTSTGAKVWTVQFAPLYNPTNPDPDDAVDMTNHLYVGVTQQVGFDFAGVPSGQNLFLMFADSSASVGIVVTGRSPADQSSGAAVNTGDTVNTSKGGGATTIGTNNQMIDPPSTAPTDFTSPPGEGMVFSFVTDPVSNFTVPNLTHGEAIVEDNIDFGGLFETQGAVFVFAQMQPSKAATVKLTAYEADFEEKTAYVNGLLDDSTKVIDRVKVYADGSPQAALLADVAIGDAGVTVGSTFTEGGIGVTFLTNGTVVVSGVVSKNALEYHTTADHNRILIENFGSADANYNASFDIGGFFLPNDVVTPLEVGSAINFEDDGPKLVAAATGIVDEDGLTGASVGIAGGPSDIIVADTDLDANESTTAGVLTALYSPGNDGLGSFGLDDTYIANIQAFDTAATPALLTLTSKGDLVKYDVIGSASGDTLWGFVDVGGTANVYESGTDRAVFKLELTNTASTGNYKFSLLDQLDHPATVGGDDVENNLTLKLGAVLKITDKDGDSLFGNPDDLKITVNDDTPVFTSISNIVGFNTGAPLTGVYDAKMGADEPGNGAADGVVLLSVSATTAGGRASIPPTLPTQPVTWLSEDGTSVTYRFDFNYYTSNVGSNTAPATGTVTFNKTTGTYVVDLAGPILASTTYSTSGGTSINYDTIGNNSPEITVKAYASDFFGVLTGQAASPPSDTSDLNTGGDHQFVAGETFSNVATSYVNVSTDTVGVDSDTVQAGELLNYDFYTSNPVSGPVSPPQQPGAVVNTATTKAFVDSVDITLNQINVGHEDIAVLLKLYNASLPAGQQYTTKLLLADSVADYQPIAGSTNVLVSIGADDYPAGYQIYGIQVLTSTEQVGGTGYSLSTGNAVTLGATGSDLQDSSDNDVMKIIKIEVSQNRPSDADMQFTAKVIDADGDATGTLGFSVHLEGDTQVLTGGLGSDYLNGTSGADTISGGPGADFMTGGAGADQFVLAPGDSDVDPLTIDTITDFVTTVDTIATSKAAGDATIANGGGYADMAAFIAAANAVFAAGFDDIFVAYDAVASGNAWIVIDEDNSGAVDNNDSAIVLTGINLASEIAASDFL